VLCAIRAGTSDGEFQEALKERGVNSKPLREKLCVIISKETGKG
jgi:hypothetical protein